MYGKILRNGLLISILFLLIAISSFYVNPMLVHAATEEFTTEADGSNTFSEGGITFDITGYLKVAQYPDWGYNDSFFVENPDPMADAPTTIVGAFKSASSDFHIQSLRLITLNSSELVAQINDVNIRGKLDGITKFTKTVSWEDINATPTDRYYTNVDLSSYSSHVIDELEFEVIGEDSYYIGYLMIDDFVFTEAIPAPAATTSAITGTSSTGATLNGSVNANGASTAVTFEYGTTVGYGTSVTASESPATGSSATSVSYALTGLTPNTTYHYRVVGVNSGGTTNGSDMTFTTLAVVPTVTTSAITGITTNGGILNGSVNANNASTTITFEYGTTAAYGSSVTASQSPVSGTASTAVSAALAGLSPNNTYHYRVVGVNSAGTTNGADMTFTTSALAPTVTTSAITGTSSTGATLNGSVNANGASTAVTFEYGITAGYGTSVTASESPATGSSATSVSYALTGLTPNTTYHYRVVGVNSGGTTNGSDMTFTTSAVVPTVTTSAVTGITTNGGILNGSVNANNASTVVTFEYGTTAGYGASVTASQSPISGTASTAVSAALTGLNPNTTYHYRVVGVNSAGTTNGLDGTFTTSAVPATVTTAAVTGITGTGATLNGSVNANGASTAVTFEYGITAGYGTSVTASESPATGSSANSVSYTLSGLIPNTTYHYRVVGVNSGGTTNGSDMTFTTSAVVPTATTSAVTSVTSNGATLNGSINANNASTTVTFEYGMTAAYGSSVTASQSPVSGTASTAVSAALTGLSPNTTYHYRVVGVNTAGTTNGSDMTFTTSAVVPTATTSAVSSITSNGAILNGSVNANNASTVVTFEYGTTAAYGTSIGATGSPATGSSATSVSYTLSGLTPNTTYHYRVVGVNSGGTTNGSDMTFATSAVVPAASTSAVTSVTSKGAILNGSVNANNASTLVTFEYGTTAAYGLSVTAGQSPVSGTALTAVSAALTGLSPNTTYHFRVVGVNTAGTTNGVDGTFTTSAIPFAVTINTNKDGTAAAAPGSVELKQGGSVLYTAANSGVGVYTASAFNGTYDIFINGEDTNENITISGAANNATVSYYTVSFAVSNAGTATGSSISATASGAAITSGAAVLAGKSVTITAAGAGASTYTYLWSGTGTSGQATASMTLSSLSSSVSAICTVNGTTNNNTGGGGGTNTTPSTGADIIVNGEKQTAGTSSTQTVEGKTITTVTVDDTKLDKILEEKGNNPTITIPLTAGSDVTVGVLNGQTVKNMEQKEAVLEIKTDAVTYTLPASEININDVSSQFGEAVQLKDIKISVSIAEPPATTVRIVEDTANKNSFQLVVKPVEFEITCTSGNKTVNVSKFNGYVERTVAIPEGVDPSKITTGIVLNADGTFSHVPTTIIKIDGKYYAKINSLTNSTYSVIYNPIKFADVAKHWAKDSINEMGSRLIVSGSGNGNYSPNKEINRAEFAAIVIRALGLKAEAAGSEFTDVKNSSWYAGYVETAVSYGIITGYSNGKFGPSDKITREQAMTMIARAMKLTGLYSTLTETQMNVQISSYADGASSSKYAKEGIATCLKTGVVSGKSSSKLAPKAYITRAEVAVIIERLLQKSELI